MLHCIDAWLEDFRPDIAEITVLHVRLAQRRFRLCPSQVQELAVRAFRALDGAGLARVDFFIPEGGGAPIVNEVNTMPGFTPISMYPRMWAASGLPYPELLDVLIATARARTR